MAGSATGKDVGGEWGPTHLNPLSQRNCRGRESITGLHQTYSFTHSSLTPLLCVLICFGNTDSYVRTQSIHPFLGLSLCLRRLIEAFIILFTNFTSTILFLCPNHNGRIHCVIQLSHHRLQDLHIAHLPSDNFCHFEITGDYLRPMYINVICIETLCFDSLAREDVRIAQTLAFIDLFHASLQSISLLMYFTHI